MFRFESDDHTYWLGTLRLRSVTEVLHDNWMLPDYSKLDPFYRERGSAVHAAIGLDLLGQLDDASLDPEHVLPYVQRFRRWVEASGFQPFVVEQPMYCPAFLYAGTPDAAGFLRSGELVVPDWKTGAFEPGHRVQVAGGYLPMLEQAAAEGRLPVTEKEMRRASVCVLPLNKETPEPVWVPAQDIPQQRELFRSALGLTRWREQEMSHGTTVRVAA